MLELSQVLPFTQFRIPTQRTELLTAWVGIPTTLHPIWIIPSHNAQKCASLVTLDPVKLTTILLVTQSMTFCDWLPL